MRRLITATVMSLAMAAVLGGVSSRAGEPAKDEGGCGKHGTTVEFFDTPSDAARHAQKEQKLVFVLHVSGEFENSGLT